MDYPTAKQLADDLDRSVSALWMSEGREHGIQHALGDGEYSVQWGRLAFHIKDDPPARPHFWAVLSTGIGLYRTAATRPSIREASEHAERHAAALLHRLLASVLSLSNVDQQGESSARVLSGLCFCGSWPGLEKALACVPVEPAPAEETGLARVVVLGDESDPLD